MKPTMRIDRSRILRMSLLAALGLLITWQVVSRSFAAYLARQNPHAALELRANEPDALVSLAEERLTRHAGNAREPVAGEQVLADRAKAAQQPSDRLGGWAEIALKALADKLDQSRAPGVAAGAGGAPAPLTPHDREQIRSIAELALVNDPLNARALRILGQLADAAGDKKSARGFMRAAARSLGESIAVYWMLNDSFVNKNYAKTIYYADAFLRKRPHFIAHAIPMLGRIAEGTDPDALAALEKVLLGDPPWRRPFFSALMSAITDARTPLKLLLSLKDSHAPPTSQDLSGYLNFLIGRKLYELAYYTWLQFLPPGALSNVGLLTNGRFETPPSGLPFDWVISPGSGVTIDIVARPETSNNRALLLEFGLGRADFRGVSQLLMLLPGTYRLTGRFKGQINGRRGVQWHVTCAGSSAPIADGPMFIGVEPKWTDFDFTFMVPEAECRAQELRLDLAARSASEQLVSGSAWYDDLRIARPEPRTASEPASAPR